MAHVKTPDQVRKEMEARGETLAAFARSNGFDPKDVYRVMGGVFKGKYGRSHQIAVKLGLKTGEVQA